MVDVWIFVAVVWVEELWLLVVASWAGWINGSREEEGWVD